MKLDFEISTQGEEVEFNLKDVQIINTGGGVSEARVRQLITEQTEGKYDKTGGVIGGDVSIQGNLSVSGTTTTKDTETVMVKDNVIVANSDGNTLIEDSGFAIKTSTTSAYGIMYSPLGDGVKIGLGSFDENGKFIYDDGEAQFLATRADTLTDGNLPQWDNEKKQFVDSGAKLDDYTKKTDIADYLKLGLVASGGENYYGFVVSSGNGLPRTVKFDLTKYKNLNDFFFIGKGTLENIKNDLVKRAIVENDIDLTPEEQAIAKTWLGIGEGGGTKLYKHNISISSSSSGITLIIVDNNQTPYDNTIKLDKVLENSLKATFMGDMVLKFVQNGINSYSMHFLNDSFNTQTVQVVVETVNDIVTDW